MPVHKCCCSQLVQVEYFMHIAAGTFLLICRAKQKKNEQQQQQKTIRNCILYYQTVT